MVRLRVHTSSRLRPRRCVLCVSHHCASATATVRGCVRFYDARVRFYGFLTAEDGRDVHVSRNHIKKGHQLYPETPVEFEVLTAPRGLQARKVRVVAA